MRHGPAYEARMRDPFGFYSDKTESKRGSERRHPRSDAEGRAASAREQALAVFDLDPPFTQVNLKAKYKVLVKLHHPDAHGGDKAAEEKLKIINQAYTTLKASYLA
jgi:DnaJ-domain-containing protein 1